MGMEAKNHQVLNTQKHNIKRHIIHQNQEKEKKLMKRKNDEIK